MSQDISAEGLTNRHTLGLIEIVAARRGLTKGQGGDIMWGGTSLFLNVTIR
jgi:hypothetical protein